MQGVTAEPSTQGAWTGPTRGPAAYRWLLAALFCVGVATFAVVFTSAVLPLVARDFGLGAASASLLISASTVGLAIGAIPWSALADCIGRVKAISILVAVATLIGMLVPELRVSLWAQQLGTPRPVSERRIYRAIDAITA